MLFIGIMILIGKNVFYVFSNKKQKQSNEKSHLGHFFFLVDKTFSSFFSNFSFHQCLFEIMKSLCFFFVLFAWLVFFRLYRWWWYKCIVRFRLFFRVCLFCFSDFFFVLFLYFSNFASGFCLFPSISWSVFIYLNYR